MNGIGGGAVAGSGVVVSGAVAVCEAPVWPGGLGTSGAAAVSLTRSSSEDVTAVLLGSDIASVTAGSAAAAAAAAATAGSVPASAVASFHYTPELNLAPGGANGPMASPEAGSNNGGTMVVVSGVAGDLAAAAAAGRSTWRCWFGTVGRYRLTPG